MDTSKLDLVPLKHSIDYTSKKVKSKEDLIKIINDRFGDCICEVIYDIEFVNRVCNIVETCLIQPKNKKYKIDKKALVIEAISTVASSLCTPEVIKKIENDIEHLHNHKMIKKVPYSKYILKKASDYFGKQFL